MGTTAVADKGATDPKSAIGVLDVTDPTAMPSLQLMTLGARMPGVDGGMTGGMDGGSAGMDGGAHQARSRRDEGGREVAATQFLTGDAVGNPRPMANP